MYAFQLFEVFFDSDDVIDTDNIWWIIPICMITIPFVYFIRIKLYDKHVHGIDLEAMDAELQELKQKDIQTSNPPTSSTASELEETELKSISEELNTKLSTGNIENMIKGIQERVQGWLHFKL
ncbi:hypothetical protein ACNR9Q_11850 [Maribacter sp. X9]|uniref:hypothetical protein n=1 Tax=Maribacter sp. X9 TaxID=3402159 RepID=UPI003AF3F1C7